jgi:hypothetical protein
MILNYNNKYVFWSLIGLSSLGLLTFVTKKWCSYFNNKRCISSSSSTPSGIEFNMVKPKSDDEKHE